MNLVNTQDLQVLKALDRSVKQANIEKLERREIVNLRKEERKRILEERRIEDEKAKKAYNDSVDQHKRIVNQANTEKQEVTAHILSNNIGSVSEIRSSVSMKRGGYTRGKVRKVSELPARYLERLSAQEHNWMLASDKFHAAMEELNLHKELLIKYYAANPQVEKFVEMDLDIDHLFQKQERAEQQKARKLAR